MHRATKTTSLMVVSASVAFILSWNYSNMPLNPRVAHDGLEVPPWAEQPPASQVMKFEIEDNENQNEFELKQHHRNAIKQHEEQTEIDPWKRQNQNVWKLMILFQHNLPILRQAVHSFERASAILVPNLIIIDNSQDKEAMQDTRLSSLAHAIIPTNRTLNFPELHNFMASLALELKLEFYLWAHADNYVLPLADGRDMGKDVVDCLREKIAEENDWGLVLFAYDHLAAFRTQALIQVPWDPHVFQYGSECDEYGRLNQAGYAAKACKVHLSYDMKEVLDIQPSDTYEAIRVKLETAQLDKQGRNKWREQSMSEAERRWREEMKQYSRKYLESKWGEVKCKLKDTTCQKPWPYCPKCPAQVPDCLDKNVPRDRLKKISALIQTALTNDEEQPPPFQA